MDNHGAGTRAGSDPATLSNHGAQIVVLICLCLVPDFALATPLAPGQTINPRGTSSFQQPVLIGRIVANRLIPFEMLDNNETVIVTGVYEDRVVQSSDTGSYIFQGRLRELTSTTPIDTLTISVLGYEHLKTDADYLSIGIGNITPEQISRSPQNGGQIDIVFTQNPGSSSTELPLLSIVTNSTAIHAGNTRISIQSRQGTYSTSLSTFSPDTSATQFVPAQGFWWNPQRPGHGIDLQIVQGKTVFAVWYTYLHNRQPIWYLGSHDYSGNSWSSSMDSYQWDGEQATPTSVGQFGFDFIDSTHAEFWWQFDQQPRHKEVFEFFRISSEASPFDYSGVYFQTNQPGYGLSLATQGSIEFSVLYFFDQHGQPTWVTGSTDQCGASYSLNSLTGYCPTCPISSIESRPTGILDRTVFSNHIVVNTDITLTDPLSGHWLINNVTMKNLSGN